ncbi:hypothetical protein QTG54_000122 [Skeletonema marinoi]|uniref:Uncharacterized protein n=1 Tax=Skeletonema marinoi TaxID=267567 RepID=A0AAD9DJX9_9STRA|nr:hypothetical protein QTG54_000122 [Skeletonema marinoi]
MAAEQQTDESVVALAIYMEEPFSPPAEFQENDQYIEWMKEDDRKKAKVHPRPKAAIEQTM